MKIKKKKNTFNPIFVKQMSWFNYPNFSCIKMVVNFDNCCVYFDWLKTITKKTPLMLLGGSYKYGCLTNSAKYISAS